MTVSAITMMTKAYTIIFHSAMYNNFSCSNNFSFGCSSFLETKF